MTTALQQPEIHGKSIRQSTQREHNAMRSPISRPAGRAGGIVSGLFAGLLLLAGQALAGPAPDQQPQHDPATAEQRAQRHFATPEAAMDALVQALEAADREQLVPLFGPEAEQVLPSGDAVADREMAKGFLALAKEKVAFEEQGKDRLAVNIGKEAWPFAIPLSKDKDGWYFDTPAGREELLARRIGSNELHAIASARAYVDAQLEYARMARERTGVRQYAHRLVSSEGERDGLYWEVEPGEPESPMGPLVAAAADAGYSAPEAGREPSPYYGYYFKILTAQGGHAPGGAKNYLDDQGRMTRGFALLAYPAEYGNSGIMSFIVNHRGMLFQKDLGEQTGELARAMTEYDPDESWEPVMDVTD